jgi:hypothetical protein
MASDGFEESRPPDGGYDYEATLVPFKEGRVYDITSQLALMYDLVVHSMDWGSRLFDEEDRRTVAQLGILCGFEVPRCEATMIPKKGDYPEGTIVNYALCQKQLTHDGPHSGEIRVTEPMPPREVLMAAIPQDKPAPEGFEWAVNASDGTLFLKPVDVDMSWPVQVPRFKDSYFVPVEW